MRIPALTVAVLLAASLTACGSASTDAGGSGQDPAGTQPSGTPPTPDADLGTPTTVPTDLPVDPPKPGSNPTVPPPVDSDPPAGLRERPEVQEAVSDAAERSGVRATQVTVAAYTLVTWNDGSLGCPRDGESYTMMQVPGELLVLRAGDELLSYHAGDDARFRHCANPSDGWTPRTG